MPKKPFFRKFDGWYYTQIIVGGKRKQVKLVKGKENQQEAYRAFCRLMADTGQLQVDRANQSVANVCDLFLDQCERRSHRDTYLFHRHYLQDFCGKHGRVMVSDLKLYHVNTWLDSHPTWKASRRHAIVSLKAAFHWAEINGYITVSPIRHVKKPPGGRRTRVLNAEERTRILAAIEDETFRDFVLALQETGCRPAEVINLTAENVDLENGMWVIHEHKTAKKTGKPRIVYLSPVMVALSRKLVNQYPTGSLFRGCHGQPLNGGTIQYRFKLLRAALHDLPHFSPYTYRHTYTTEALLNGVGIVQLAELLGHSDTGMIMRHYQHINQKTDHLRELAAKAMSRG